jgi:pilus assembly protein Flp/PilA
MKRLILKWKLWRDTRGQDLIEYALMVGFVALAAAATMPFVAQNISTIFASINTLLTSAANQTSGS